MSVVSLWCPCLLRADPRWLRCFVSSAQRDESLCLGGSSGAKGVNTGASV